MQKLEPTEFAQHYVAKQERSESELYQAMIKGGFDPETAKETLAYAVAQSWVSDQRYCERYCERRLCKGYGPMHITEELRDKGLPTSAIVKAIADFDFSTWEHAAMLALEKKFGNDYKSQPRIKVISFLEQRGFNDEYMLFLIKDE